MQNLKCIQNKNKIGFPNYLAPTDVVAKTGEYTGAKETYVADEDCYIYGYVNSGSTSIEMFLRITINENIIFAGYSTRNWGYLFSGLYPVKKGDAISFNYTTNNGAVLRKFPILES